MQNLCGKIVICGVVVLLIVFKTISFSSPLIVGDYQPIFNPGYNQQQQLLIAIRSYQQNGTRQLLVVNPDTFKTQTILSSTFNCPEMTAAVKIRLANTPYMKALIQYTSPPFKLYNYGVIHALSAANGEFLTVDMCPSHRFFEKKFFDTLGNLSEKMQRSIPVAISITGRWMIKHPDEFAWLLQQQNENKLNITWIDHTYQHRYYRFLPGRINFLLLRNTNFTQEVLMLEQALIEHGQTPSVFFRFPGLVSNQKLVLQLRTFGLIPIGTDAWLALNQNVKPGSIILVHGNSNEHEGINKIMTLMDKENLNLLPLAHALFMFKPIS